MRRDGGRTREDGRHYVVECRGYGNRLSRREKEVRGGRGPEHQEVKATGRTRSVGRNQSSGKKSVLLKEDI